MVFRKLSKKRKKMAMNDTLTDNQQLKPCPFCGYEDVRLRSNITLDHYVWCYKCGTSGPHEDLTEEAARRWNERDNQQKGFL